MNGMDNPLQLAIIEIMFQFVGIFMSVGLTIFQTLLTDALGIVFDAFFDAVPLA